MIWRESDAGHMIEDLKNICGLVDPIVIYYAREAYIEFFVYASPRGSTDNSSNYLMNFTEMQAMGLNFKDQFQGMLEQAHNERQLAPQLESHLHLNLQPLTLEIIGKNGPAKLSPKEVEILNLLIRGMSGKEIANVLSLSTRTIETHIAAIRHKTGFHKKSELVNNALEQLYTINIRSERVNR